MVVLNQFELKGRIFGYCSCGREVEKKELNDMKCPLCGINLEWEYSLKVGDTIKCGDKNDLVKVMKDLEKNGVHVDFLYTKDGKEGFWLIVQKVEETNG